MYVFLTMFMQFLIYSILGWIIESISCSIYYKKKADRGFLIGPYCPIYGTSAMIMILILGKYKDDKLVLFMMSIVVASILEYITSYILEKLFRTRWWDYSYRTFNINGRVCLINSLGVILLHFIDPIIMNFIFSLSIKLLYPLSMALIVLFISDMVASICIIIKLNKSSDMLKKDCSSEINSQIRKTLSKKSKLFSRMSIAYPCYQILPKKFKIK